MQNRKMLAARAEQEAREQAQEQEHEFAKMQANGGSRRLLGGAGRYTP